VFRLSFVLGDPDRYVAYLNFTLMANTLLLETGGDNRKHAEYLTKLASNCKGPMQIASAYVTDRGLFSSASCIRQLLTPLRPIDIVSGATSVETLRSLIVSGVECRTLPDSPRFHGKVYIFGDDTAVVTSANLTLSGIHRNIEAGVSVAGADARQVAKWYRELWDVSTPISISDLSKIADETRELRDEYERLRKNANAVIPRQQASEHEMSPISSVAKLFENAKRFFICNTNRRYSGHTETGGFLTEELMFDNNFAAAWESFDYDAHMQQVEAGDAILMYAKGVGIVGVGIALGNCETLPFGAAERLTNEIETPEWRVPTRWMAWTDDSAALDYKSANYTFANISGDSYSQLLSDAERHFSG
jgi:hypothetical protein